LLEVGWSAYTDNRGRAADSGSSPLS